MNNKLEEVARLFNIIFPSYVMKYKQENDPFMDIIDISINEYYHVRITGEMVLEMSIKRILSEITHIFVDLKMREVKENGN